jgi:hypothetical protein
MKQGLLELIRICINELNDTPIEQAGLVLYKEKILVRCIYTNLTNDYTNKLSFNTERRHHRLINT